MSDLKINEIKVMPKFDAKEKLEEAANEYTSIFFSQLLKGMFAGRETDPIFGGGQSEEIYRDMLTSEYGKQLAKNDNTGVNQALKKSLLKLQEI